MYSEKNIFKLTLSFNCSIINDTFKILDTFSVDVVKVNNENIIVKLGINHYNLEDFKVNHLRKYICDMSKVAVFEEHTVKLWKVDVDIDEVDEVSIKELLKDEMKPLRPFQSYFKTNEIDRKNYDPEKTHIIAIIPTTTATIEDIIKIALKDSIALTSLTHTSQTHTSRSDTFDWEDMPLKDRDLSKAAVIVKDNVINYSKGLERLQRSRHPVLSKPDFNILVCGGAHGIGKTRFGNDLFYNIKTNKENLFGNIISFKHFEYIHLDFGNSIRLDEQDYGLKNEEIICLRILYEYFIMNKYILNFDTFRERFLPYIKILNIQNVIESIRNSLSLKDTERLFIFLHIDEFQLIFKWDEGRDDKLFKYIIYVLVPEYMYGNGCPLAFVQGFLSGTARQAAMREKEASMPTLEHIKCPMLSMKSMIEIVDFYAKKCGAEKINGEYSWKLCAPFLQAIQDTGGLPRALQQMLIICFQGLNTKSEFFNNISEQNFERITRLTADKLQNLYDIYNAVDANKHLALELLYHCVMGKLVTAEECLDPYDKTNTMENLEKDTHIILKESDERDYYYIEMPFLFLILYNDVLKIISTKLEKTFNIRYLQDWELFVAYYEAFINNMLFMRGNKREVTLRELYRGVYGKDATLNRIVKLKNLNVCQCLQQFLGSDDFIDINDNKPIKWEEGNEIVVNDKGNLFGDSFVVRDIICGSKISKALVIVHNRWDYDSEELNEYIKLKNLAIEGSGFMKKFDDPTAIMIFFTTKPYNFDHNLLPENTLLVGKPNFKKYFGHIFSSRAKFYLTKDTDPNFSELSKIRQVISGAGDITAGEIVSKRPYYDLDNFLDKHKRIKRQKLDDANIKLEFFPYNL